MRIVDTNRKISDVAVKLLKERTVEVTKGRKSLRSWKNRVEKIPLEDAVFIIASDAAVGAEPFKAYVSS